MFLAPQGVTIPVTVSAFPDEPYQAPRTRVERTFPKLIHYNRLPKGGHFAAWEQPKLFTLELRAAFQRYAEWSCQAPQAFANAVIDVSQG